MLFGSALNGWGVRRLLKALRHEAPGPAATCYRLGVEATAFYPFKVSYGGTVGRLVLGRVLGGAIEEGSELRGRDKQPARLGTLFAVQGDKTLKVSGVADGSHTTMFCCGPTRYGVAGPTLNVFVIALPSV